MHAEAEAARTPSLVNRVVAASLRQRLLVMLAAAAILALGFWSFQRLRSTRTRISRRRWWRSSRSGRVMRRRRSSG
jgi:hypothetical protein